MKVTKPRFHYGWIIVLICFFCCFSYGLFYSFGVFFKHLQQEFGWSRALTSTIQSLHMIFFPVSALIIGWLTDKYGPKLPLIGGATLIGSGIVLLSVVQSPIQFFMFYALASLGSGIIWSLPMGIIQHWFVKRRGLALGFSISGIGFSYALSPLSSLLISNFGWRTAYQIQGSVIWVILIFCAWAIAGSPRQKGLKPYGAETVEDISVESELEGWEAGPAVKTISFWGICGMWVCHVFAVMIVAVHLVNYATDIGMSEVHGATTWFMVGCFSIPGRILGAYIGEKIGYRKGFSLFGLFNAIAVIWLLGAKNLWMLMLFAPFYGFCYGGQTPIIAALIGNYFGLKPLSTLLGLQMFTGMIGGTLGPWLAGFLFDRFSNYYMAFITASGFWALSAFLSHILRKPQKQVI